MLKIAAPVLLALVVLAMPQAAHAVGPIDIRGCRYVWVEGPVVGAPEVEVCPL
jgi:hypothetical protein